MAILRAKANAAAEGAPPGTVTSSGFPWPPARARITAPMRQDIADSVSNGKAAKELVGRGLAEALAFMLKLDMARY